uniref:DNA 3'-5' helicase n=1 Tax=uncultured Chloroflexota bacterium TaxID=166587 RepID=H5SID9_9CHLR|nr:UvrD/REP helicase domain-containing protein [uncultured Chloroflexota bacterium]
MENPFGLRPSQQAVLRFRGGKMGIAAVPGAGKTYVLSALAAHLIAEKRLDENQEVLIVTLTNSAVDNFSTRIAGHLKSLGLLPHLGYRVRTLHGLAHDILREKPEKVGLDERFTILDEYERGLILHEVAMTWLSKNPQFIEAYIGAVSNQQQVRQKHFQNKVEELANAFIRMAKDLRLTPSQLHEKLKAQPLDLPLVQMGCEIYTDYQRVLSYRGSVDFDDLVRLALDLLESDPEYLERLRHRWPFILEDEAQDSSRSQEQLLRLLVGEATIASGRGWVRVGDPNQAIYETFTTANPMLLHRFIEEEADERPTLHESGRSQAAIIELANRLIEWSLHEHPNPHLRGALWPPFIRPVSDGSQVNPPQDSQAIYLHGRPQTPEEEIKKVLQSLARWLPQNPDKTVAVLVPDNRRGNEVSKALEKANIPVIEFLRTTQPVRATASVIAEVLRWLNTPHSAAQLSHVYQKVWRREREKDEIVLRSAEWLKKCQVESYLFPFPAEGIEEILPQDPPLRDELLQFRQVARRWQALTLLPIEQLVLSLAQDIFSTPSELALAHKMAHALGQRTQEHPEWTFHDLIKELTSIAANERRFTMNMEEGFNPDDHKGKVVVATIHKAKGLEWDRVYVISVSNYDFPSAEEWDSYKAEDWFIRDQLNLQAEMLEQLNCLLYPQEYQVYVEGKASRQARIDYARERLRLLYVAITRARRELILTWNEGGRRKKNIQALPFTVLQNWLKNAQEN